ncbi:MAG: hypothetical protein HY303_02230 [Candidatus Wallbacteria bacterium]|nr:hypothetical protein [Candidatus Wallbacteria bacterium]
MKTRPSLQGIAILVMVSLFVAFGAALAFAKTQSKEDQPAGLAKILGEEPAKGARQKPLKITGFEIAGNQNVSEQVVLLTLESKIGRDFSQ